MVTEKPQRDGLETMAREYVRASADLKRKVADECIQQILEAASLITETFRGGGKVLLCGNGGSAADCQHMAAEFVSVLNQSFTRRALPAVALTTDSSFLTAYSNDFGYDGVFERQVEALGRPGDLLLGISTSGNSRNVVRAIEASRAAQMSSIVLTGRGGGRLGELATIAISVPCTETQHVQEAHLTIEHLICELVERQLFAEERQPTKA